MKSLFQSSGLNRLFQTALGFLTVVVLACAARASVSPPVTVSETAASGAFATGNYTLTVNYGATPTLNINWMASGQSAVEPSGNGEPYPGQTDLPVYWIQVYDKNSFKVVGQTTGPQNGDVFLSPTGASGGFPLTPVSYGDKLTITEGAQTLVNFGGNYSITSEILNTINFVVGSDPSVFPPQGNLGPQRAGPKKQPKDSYGEPVSPTSGAFFEDHVDLHLNGPLPIEIRRTYSSLGVSATNEFGYGWLFGYSSYLIPATDGSTIQAADTDGSIVTFRLVQGSSTIWAPVSADNPGLSNSSGGTANLFSSTITQTGAGIGSTYKWQLADGTVRNYQVATFPVDSGGSYVPRQRPYLKTWQDNRGNTLTFNYGINSNANDYGRINQIQASNGDAVSLVYDTQGHILTATASSDTAGNQRKVTYGYNFFGDLISVVLPDGSEFDYQYGTTGDGNPNHLLTQATSPGSRVLQNVYDGQGRVVQQLATVDQDNPGGLVAPGGYALVAIADFDYGTPGQTTISDAFGKKTIYQYNASGLITQITYPLGETIVQNWYNSTGSGAYANSLHTVKDERGLVTTYQYDNQGNVTETDLTGDLIGDTSTVTVPVKKATYNGLNLPTSVTDASGFITDFTYGDGNLNHAYLTTQVNLSKLNGSGTKVLLRTDKFTYEDKISGGVFSNGLLSNETDAADGSGSSDHASTDYVNTAAGVKTKATRHPGTGDTDVVTNFAYNARNEVVTVTDGDNRTFNYTYDNMGRETSKIVKDENGNTLGTWTTTYTGEGEVSLTSGPHASPTVNTVQRYYDGAGRLEEADTNLSQAKADGTGVTASAQLAITDYVYDFMGRCVLEMDPIGNVTIKAYDDDGHLTGRNVYTGSNTAAAPLRTESFLYEAGGLISQYTSPINGVTQSYYTSTGQLRRQVNPDGSVFEWRYYTDGRVQKEIRRDQSYWLTTYDDINRTVTRQLYQSTGVPVSPAILEISVSDRRHNVIAHQDVDGFVRTVAYDALSRPKVLTGPPATSSSAQQTTTFIYTASDKTVVSFNALGEVSLAYFDALSRPQLTELFGSTDLSKPPVRVTTWNYSADNNSTQVIDGSPTSAVSRTIYTDTLDRPVLNIVGDGTYARAFTTRVFDVNGNLITTTDALGQATNYGYNALNQRTSETLPDNALTQFHYDAAGNLLSTILPDGSLSQLQAYDAAGRITSESLASGANSTRNYTYGYYPSGSFVGLLQTVTGPRDTVTTAYDTFFRPSTVTTAGAQAQVNSSTVYSYDNRGDITGIAQSSTGSAAGPATNIVRTFDGYGQILTETVTAGGATLANIIQTWDGGGRRASLNDASSLPVPLFAYQHRADGLLTQVTANNQNYVFAYADNGLLTSRTNPSRTLTIDSRDPVGRITHETAAANGTTVFVDGESYRNDGTLSAYGVGRTDGWNETRHYSYNSRGQLLSEDFSSVVGQAATLNYIFDGANPGLGVRLDAKIGTGSPSSWEYTSAANNLGQVATDNLLTASGQSVPTAAGTAANAAHVDIFVDGVSQGRATLSSGTWSMALDLSAGSHVLKANAVDGSGLHTTSATRSFTVNPANAAEQLGAATESYDGEGNLGGRSWTNGTTQTLTWDAQNRPIKVSRRDSSGNGYDWTAIYDGLGRRLATSQQVIAGNLPSGSATLAISEYDPQAQFLEIGVTTVVGGTSAKAWKVYGPDLDERFGGLQGTGGLESTILDSGGVATGVLNDRFGNAVATISGSTVSWNATRVGGYGPLPGNAAAPLANAAQLAQVIAWGGHYVDPTGFYYLGHRYYDPVSGRFISTDPLGQAASKSLYSYCDGDPLNNVDPTGLFLTGGSNPSPAFVESLTATETTEVATSTPAAAGISGATMLSATGVVAAGAFTGTMIGIDAHLALDTSRNNAIADAALANALHIEANLRQFEEGFIIPEDADPNDVDEFQRLRQIDPVAARRKLTDIQNKAAESAASADGSKFASNRGNSANNGAAEAAGTDAYSVAFKMRLAPESYPGLSRAAHFQEANEALLQAMEGDAQFAKSMEDLGISLDRTPTGLAPRQSPAGWTWHHAEGLGDMELVPRYQHTPGSDFWEVLHPDGNGGYYIWGK